MPEEFQPSKYIQMNLMSVVHEIGEDKTRNIISKFECPQNKDVQNFLYEKSIIFSKQSFSKTHLVFHVTKNTKDLVGYYTIAARTIRIKKQVLSNTAVRKLKANGAIFEDGHYVLWAPLIAQLGKNYANNLNELISGDDLLQMAMNKVREVQYDIGGRIAYIECEDKPKLIKFYERNGFKVFDKRRLDKDETDINGCYLIQLYTIL